MANTSDSVTNQSLAVAEESSITDAFAPESRFECPICLFWLRDPVVTSCGHRFCRKCILDWLQRENSCCPVDNMKLEKENDIFPDNFTRREISQQRTRCPNVVRGCMEELTPLDIDNHLLICKFQPPELPDNEKLRCSYVDVGCEEKFEDDLELQRHLEQCIQRHLLLVSQAYRKQTINEENASSSAIAQQANFWDPPSKTPSAQPNNEDVNGLLRNLYEKIVILEQKTREQDIIIANMSEQIASHNLSMSKMQFRHCNGCYIWYMNDFKTKLNAMRTNPVTMHYSPGFFTSPNGYKLCLRLNISQNNRQYIAILIHMMKTEYDYTLEWPFCGRLTITLIHPTMPSKHIKETMMTRPDLTSFQCPVNDLNPRGFGYTDFVLIDDILTKGYLKDNQLIIKVMAQPI